MSMTQFFRFTGGIWSDGVRIALMNVLLAAGCSGTFLGTLAAISALNERGLARNGSSAQDIPFPYMTLLVSYAVICPAVWVWIGWRLPATGQPRFWTSLIGAIPMVGLSLVGYAAAACVSIVIAISPESFPIAGVFVFAFLATLVLFAAVTNIGLVFACRSARATEE